MSQPAVQAKLAIQGGTPYRTTPFPKRTPFGEEEIELTREAIHSQNLFGPSGDKVAAFERAFADLYGANHAVSSTSGTAAIHLAIGALNPNPGDEIITGPITDAGSIIPILYQGCIPIFADINETYTLDPADVERKITPRTAAIMAIHLFGNACDMAALTDIAQRHHLPLIEDCSQAHMTQYKGRYLGTWGDIAAFSLQQSKHMTTGDGGMTITNRKDWAERMALFADKGWTRKPGYGARSYAFLAPNYRMTELQGAVGLAQVKKVRHVVEKRMALGHYLSTLIGEVDGVTPAPNTPGSEHSYWLYALGVTGWPVQQFAEALSKEGVPAGAAYTGDPIYLCMDALLGKKTFGNSGYPLDGSHGGRQIEYTKGMCPRAEDALQHMVTIGLHENYSPGDIEDIANAIRKVAALLKV